MSYSILAVEQGSPEWHAARATRNTASEAPVIMGASPHMTRNELLRRKAGGGVPPVHPIVQAVYDSGHEAEAAARTILEERRFGDLYPVTAVSNEDDRFLASVDGITMDDSTLFEHKLYSLELAREVAIEELSPCYYWQLEHQLYVTGAERVVFVCSDGTREKWAECEYKPVPGRREQLLAAWRQFDLEVANYVEPAAIPPRAVGHTPDSLPALHINISGAVVDSNLADYQRKASAVFATINRSLTTREEVADGEQAIKWCHGIESRIAEAKELSMAKNADMNAAYRIMNAIAAEARALRLDLTRGATAFKDALRSSLLDKARATVREHIAGCNAWLPSPYITGCTVDLEGAMRNKKSEAGLVAALDAAVANAKVEVNQRLERIQTNLAIIEAAGPELAFLFSDRAELVQKKDAAALQAIVDSRCAEHKRRQEMQAEAERQRVERIAREAAERTEKEQAERERVAQEQEAASLRAVQRVMSGTFVPQGLLASTSPPETATPPAEDACSLTQINAMLAPLTITGEGLRQLGFVSCGTDKMKRATLYRAADFENMLTAIIKHCISLRAAKVPA